MPEPPTMKMSSVPSVTMTRTSSSPSRRLMAMSPSRRDESYSWKAVFFTWPFFVAKNRNRSVPNSRVSMMAWMCSSGARGSRFTIGRPLAVRSRSGISWARSRYTLPRLEKNSR